MQRGNQVEIYRLEEEEEEKRKKMMMKKNRPTEDEERSKTNKSLNYSCQEEKLRKSASNLVGTVQIGSSTNLITSSLSPNGKWLVLCDASSTYAFSLNLNDEEGGTKDEEMFQPQQVKLPDAVQQGVATAFHFSKEEEDVLFSAVASTNKLLIVNLNTMEWATTPLTAAPLPVHSIQTSKDFLVTLSHARGSGIEVFRRDPSSPLSLESYWNLPMMENSRIAATCLLGGNDSSQIAIATFASRLFVFDLQSKRLSRWSEQIGYPIKKWPSELSARRDFPVRLMVHPSNPSQLLLVSSTFHFVSALKVEEGKKDARKLFLAWAIQKNVVPCRLVILAKSTVCPPSPVPVTTFSWFSNWNGIVGGYIFPVTDFGFAPWSLLPKLELIITFFPHIGQKNHNLACGNF